MWKKKQGKIICGCLVLTLSMSGLTGCDQVDKIKESVLGTQEETETELAEGKKRAKIQVVSITGNELTYIEEETEAESESEAVTGTGIEEGSEKEAEPETEPGTATENTTEVQAATASTESMQQNGERGNMSRGGGQRPDRSQMFEEGEMPDMSQMFGEGEMPDMSQIFGGGEMPDMSQMGSFGGNTETVTVYLPVGVKVYTDTGKEMNFAILQAGDELEVLFETNEAGNEVITEIQMLGE